MRKSFYLLFLCAGAITAILDLGQVFPYASDVYDLAARKFYHTIRLDYPLSYLLYAPFFHFADHLTLLSLNQHFAFLAYLNLGWLAARFFIFRKGPVSTSILAREFLNLLGFNAGYAAVFALVILVPRPMARLVAENPFFLIFDSHSHTSYSHDARQSFAPRKNLLWHARAGFNAAFITDHNVFLGAEEAQSVFGERESARAAFGLAGEEVSLFNSHWSLLGNTRLFPNGKYDTGYGGIELFLKKVRKARGEIVICNLPEYWLYHKNNLKDFVRWGAQGFEIANSVPIALDFPPSERAQVLELCRKNNLIALGATDNHGWGSTAYVWNLVEIFNWRDIPAHQLQGALLTQLSTEGFDAVRVLVRVKAEVRDNKAWLLIDPFLQLWETARSLPPSHAFAILLWLWASLLAVFLKNKHI